MFTMKTIVNVLKIFHSLTFWELKRIGLRFLNFFLTQLWIQRKQSGNTEAA